MSSRVRSRGRSFYRQLKTNRGLLLAAMGAAGVAALAPQGALGASRTWGGGGADANWLTAGNWDTLPVAGDLLLFGGALNTSAVNNFTANTTFSSLTFNSGASSFTLSGNAVTLGPRLASTNGNTSGGDIVNNSASNQTIDLNLTLAAGAHSITTASTGSLNFGVAGTPITITRNTGATVLFTVNTGAINFTNANLANDTTGILGGSYIVGTNAFATLSSGNVTANTTYGQTLSASGTLTNNVGNVKVSAVGGASINMPVVAGNVTDINTIIWLPTTSNQTATINPGTGNVLRLGKNGAIFSSNNGSANAILTVGVAATPGTITAGGAANTAGELTLYDAGNSFTSTRNNLVINSVIVDNGSGAVTVSVLGAVQFNATASTYSGGTFLNQGRLTASPGGLGSGPVTVTPGSTFVINADGTFNNLFNISGIGSTESSGLGAIRLGGAARVLAGPTSGASQGVAINLQANASVGGSGTISGKITGSGGFTIGSGNNSAGQGTVVIGGGTGLLPGGAAVGNDYSGDTQIGGSNNVAANTLQIAASANNIMPHASATNPSTGNLILNALAAAPANFDLNGTSQTINGLTNTSTNAAGNAVKSSTGTGILTFGDNNATASYSGQFQNQGAGVLALVKIGSGNQTLSGNIGSTGGITVNGGTLTIGATGILTSGAVNNIAINNGSVFALGLNNTETVGQVTLSSGSITGTGTSNLTTTGLAVQSGTLGVPLAGTGGLTKTTAGTVTLSGANTYTGTTLISAGTLSVTGSLLTTGAVTVDANGSSAGTLIGTGPAVMGNVTVSANSGSNIPTVSPGVAGIGQFNMTSLAINGGNFAVDLGPNTTLHDFISVSGAVTVPALSTAWTVTPSGGATGTYTILTGGAGTNFAGAALPTVVQPTFDPLVRNIMYAAGYSADNMSLQIAVTGGSAALTWTGTSSSAWDINMSQNWSNDQSMNPDVFFNNDAVTLTDGPANRVVVPSGTVQPSGITVTNSAGNTYTVGDSAGSGVIAGTAILTKSNTGILAMVGNNTFTGGVTLTGGTLAINGAGNASAGPIGTGALRINGGALDNTSGAPVVLATNNAQVWNADFSFTGSNNLDLGTGPVTLGANRIVTVNAGTLGVGGVISGNFSITKAGSGALSLSSASSTFGGGVTLSAGTLNINGAAALGTGTLTVNGGSIDNTSGGSVTLTTITPQSWNVDLVYGGTNSLNLGTGAVTLSANRLVTTNGTGTLTVGGIIGPNTTSLTKAGTGQLSLGGANTFVGLTINGGAVRLTTNVAAGGAGTITVNSGGSLVGAVQSITNPITLNGGTLGSAGFGTSNGAILSTADVTVTADSTIKTGDPTVVGASGSEIELSGNLQGSGNLNVTADQAGADGGAGFRLRGTGVTNYSGTITINNRVKGEINAAGAGPYTPVGTGKIVMVAGSFDATTNGNYSEFQVRNASTSTSVPTNIEITGTGLADLNFAAASAGFITTMANLKIGNQTLGVNKNNGNYTFPTVTLVGTPTFAPNTPNFGASGAATLTMGVISEDASAPGSGIIVGGGSLTTITGVSTYTGPTTVSGAGGLTLGAAASLANTSALNLNAGTFTPGASDQVNNAASVTLNGGTYALGANSETVGAVTVQNGVITSSTGVLTATSYSVQTSSATVTAILAGASAAMTKTGTGSFTLGGANTFGGGISILNGTLVSNVAGALSTGGTITLGDTSGTNNATLQMAGGGYTVSNTTGITVAAGSSGTKSITSANGSAFVINAPFTLNDNLAIAQNAASGSFRFGANFSGTGNLTVSGNSVIFGSSTVGTPAGTLAFTGGITSTATTLTMNNLAGTNAYTGDTTITSGTLKLNASDQIPDGTGKGNVSLGGTLDLNGNSETINGLSGSGTLDGKVASGAVTNTLTVGGNDATSSFGGVIKNTNGTLALTKIGNGTLTLSGANTYAGVTTIMGGTLALSSNDANSPKYLVGDSAAHSSAMLDVSGVAGGLSLAATQTLAGFGTVKGNVTLPSGAQLSPGNSIGTLSVNGNLTLNSGSATNIELGAAGPNHTSPGSSDRVSVTGTLTLGGTLNLTNTGAAGAGSYQIATAGALSGSFATVNTPLPSLHLLLDSSSGTAVYADFFRLASANAITTPVNLGNIHVGGSFGSSAVSITNNVTNDGFSERLNAAAGVTTGDATASGGPVSLLGAGASDTSISVSLGNTGTAGAKSGTVPINLQSDGTGTSGFGTTALPTQTITVTGGVYRLAAPSTITTPVTFGNYHVGDVATSSLALSNNATADLFSESLDAAVGNQTGNATALGGPVNIAPGGTSNALGVAMDTTTAGSKSGSVDVTLSSNGTGTSGLGSTALPTQTISISGAVYRLASVNTLTTPLNTGNHHVGDSVFVPLSISNTAATDGFSEKLDATIGNPTGDAGHNNGSVSLLAAGATDNSSIAIGLDTTSVGAKSGTADVSFTSNGLGTSGLGTTALPTQTLSISGTVYRLASPNALTTPLTFSGNHHVGDVVTTQTLTLTNTAASDGFSESLDASFTGTTGGATGTGSVSQLAPQASDSTSLAVGIDTSTAGHKSGTATVGLTSNGTGTSGLGNTALTSQVITVNAGDVYRLASANTISTPVNLGNVHVGDSFAPSNLTVSNTAANDGFSESLNASVGTATGDATHNSGTIGQLPAGGSDSASLAVSLTNTGTAGAKSGTVRVSLASDGTGSSGLGVTSLPFQTITVQGGVYRFAAPSTITTPINLGNIHVGDSFGTHAVTVANVAAKDGFSEKLDAASGNPTGAATHNSGTVTLLGAGDSDNTSIVVGLSNTVTGTAGAKSGTVDIAQSSDGTGTSGLGVTVLPAQTLSITGNVYRLAAPNTLGDVNVGSVHVGDPVSYALTIQNTAANDGFSEKLYATFGALTGDARTNGGSVSLLAAGGSDNTSMLVGVDTTSAGPKSGTIQVAFVSDGFGTSGLGQTALLSQTFNISGNVQATAFHLAQPNTVSGLTFSGNHHVGDVVPTQAFTITNTAPNDGFSESLDAQAGANTGGATSSGAITLLAAQQTDSTSITAGIDTSTVGHKSGSVTINFQSDGQGTSGLGITPLPSQQVSITAGDVYRLAAANTITTPVTLPNIHVGGVFSPAALTVTNTAASDGFSEKLNATVGNNTGEAINNGGSINLLAAQATDSTSLTVGLTAANTSTPGLHSGTVRVTLTSDGSDTSGLGTTALTNQTITVQGNVFRLASASTIPAVPLFVHVGGVFGTAALSLQNTAPNDGFSEKLDASLGANTGSATNNGGTISLLAPNATDSTTLRVGLGNAVQNTVGAVSGTVALNLTSNGSGTSGLGTTAITGQIISVNGQVYSGQGVWGSSTTGNWSDFSKWTTPGGVPGIAGALSAGDTATFGTIGGATTVTLDTNVSLSGITFNSATNGYTITPTGGSVITLASPITDTAGNHTIAAPISLQSTPTVNVVRSADTLTISGAISGSGTGLTKIGPGTLTLIGANTYTGTNTVTGTGTLKLDFSATGAATTILNSATTLSTGNLTGSGNFTVVGANAGSTQSISGLFLNAAHTAVTATSGTSALTLNLGAITRNVGSTVAFTAPTTGAITTTSSNDVTGILGGHATIGNDWAAASSTVNGDGSRNIVPYTAYTAIATGAIASSANSNVKFSSDTGNLTAATGTTINSLLVQEGAARTLTVTGTMKFGPKGGIYRNSGSTGNFTVTGGTITANGGGEINLSDGPFTATSNNLTIASAIANDGANLVTVNVVGYVAISSANTYTGGTFINLGRAQASNATALGPSGSTVTVYPGGEAFLNANSTWPQNYVLAGVGTTETSGGQTLGAIRTNTGTNAISGTISLAADARIAGGSGGTTTLSGKITNAAGTTGGRLELTAATGSVNSIIISNTANDWTGGLQVTAAGSSGNVRSVFLKNGASNVIPDGAGKGDVNLIVGGDAGNIARYDLNGFSETINGLNGGASTNVQVANFGSAPSVLTLGNNDATASFAGVIGGDTAPNTLSIIKTGNGTQTFTGANTYFGTTAVNGGTLALSATSTNNIPNSSAITIGASGNLNVTGLTSSTIALAGTQTLTDNGTLTGAVTAGAGTTLKGSGTVTGAATISGGTIAPGNSVGTINVNSLAVSSGTLSLEISGATSDVINVTNAASFTGGSITLSLLSPATAPFYDVLVANSISGQPTLGTTAIGRTTFSYTGSPAAPANVLRIFTSGGPATLVFTGASSTVWNNLGDTGPANWNRTDAGTTGNPNNFYDGDAVTFDNTNNPGPFPYSVNIASAVAPSSTTVTNPAGDYTFSGTGAIGGIGSLTKNGAGALTISNTGPNTYSGGTTLNAGTLNANIAGALGTGPVTLNGGSLNIGNATALGSGLVTFNGTTVDNTTAASVSLTNTYAIGSGGLTYTGATQALNLNTGAVALTAANPTITVSSATNGLTIGGVISGTGNGFTKAGPGTLTLTGSSTYTGNTVISAGVVKGPTTGSTWLGALPGGSVTIAAGAQLDIGNNGTANNLNFNGKQFIIAGTGVGGTGAIINSGSVNQQNVFQNIQLSADAAVGGTGRFDMRASSGTPLLDLAGFTLTKLGTNPFNLVGTTVTAGNILVTAGQLGVESNTVLQDGATPGANGTISLSGTSQIELFGQGTVGNFTRPIVVLAGATAKIGNNSTTTAQVGSNITLKADLEIANLGSTGAAVFSGNISDDFGTSAVHRSISKTGAPTVTLSGVNTYTGNTNLVNGTTQLGSNGALPAASTIVFGAATTNGTLDLAGFSPTVAGLSVAGTVPAGSIASQIINNSSATADSVLTVAGGTSTFAGTINDGAAHATGINVASGLLTLSGTNNYTGVTRVDGGTLAVGTLLANGTAQPLGKGTSAILLGSAATSGTLQYTGGAASLGRDVTVNGAGGGIISNTGGGLLTLSGTLTKNGNTLTLTGGQFNVTGQVVGALANSDLVIDTGANVSLASASNTYAGATIVKGTLRLTNNTTNNNIAQSPTVNVNTGGNLDVTGLLGGEFQVASGQTLLGAGTVTGATRVLTGGTLHAGAANSVGTLTTTGAVAINSGGTLDVSLGAPGAGHASPGSSSLLAAGGALSLDGTLALHDTGTAGAGSYRIATQTGAATGAFASITGPSASLHTKVDTSTAGSVFVDIFRLASVNTITTPVNLMSHHVGDPTTATLTITNTAAADGFSEKLDVSFGAPTGNATASGSISLLPAGQTDSTSMIVGIDTSMVGVRTGQVDVNLFSNGAGTSGFGQTTIGTQTIMVNSSIYRLAAPSTITTPMTFSGNHHVGDVVAGQALSLQNTAADDGFSEKLDASFTGATGAASGTGSVSLLAPQASDSTSLVVNMDTSTVGHKSGSVTVGLTSNGTGTSGLGNTALPSQTITVNAGDVYRLASANTITTPVTFSGNHHVGDVVTGQALSLQNTAADDGFSEKLDASFTGSTGGAAGTGSVSLLAPQASDSTSLVVNIDTSTVGHKSGSVTVGLTSNGTGTSGLGNTALPSQTITVNAGDVYRLASVNTITTPINLTNVHVNGTFGTAALTVNNTAATDGFSEKLDASVGNATGVASHNGGTINLLAAGGSDSSSLVVGLAGADTSVAGAKSGTVRVSLSSDGTGTSGLASTPLTSQTITVQGGVYRLASASTITTPINFGTVHTGANIAISLTNTQTADTFSEKLDAASTGSTGAAFSTGSISLLAAGSTDSASLHVGLSGPSGARTGTVTIGLTSDGTGTSGLGNTSLGSQVLSLSGTIYSGQGVWTATGNGSWLTTGNWTADGGVPGIDGALSVNDTATFGNSVSGNTTISLDGANVTLAGINFVNNTGKAYTIATGSGGSLTMGSVITVANPSLAPLPSATSTTLFPTTVQTATIATPIAGTNGLTKTGLGTLILTAANTYTGTTTLKAGPTTLDFSAAATTSNIINGGPLAMGGGTASPTSATLSVIGAAGQTISQSFAGTSLSLGSNVVSVNQNGATSVTVGLGGLSRTTGSGVNFTLPTTGSITTTTANDASGILGAWATVGAGASASWATNDGSGNIIPYTAFTTVASGGTITSNTSSNIKFTGGNISAAASGTTDVNSILEADTVARTVTVASGATLRLGALGGIYRTDNTTGTGLTIGSSGSTLTAGGAVANNPGELIFSANSTTPDQTGITVASAVKDNGTGAVSVTNIGNAGLQLNAAGTYSGGTYVASGKIRANVAGAFGTGPVYVAVGGQAYLNAGAFSNNFFLNGKGFFEGSPVFSGGALRFAANTVNVSGTITLLGDSLISTRGASGAGATMSGRITGGFALDLGFDGSTAGVLNLSNPNPNGAANSNDWTGDTTIYPGTIKVGSNEQIPSGAGFGNLILNGSPDSGVTQASTLDLNGKTETVNGLFSAGTNSKAVVTNNLAASTGTLIAGDNNADGNFGGTISNGTTPATMITALTKIGTGTLTLTGSNTYTGTTTINAGTVAINAQAALGTATSAVLLGSASPATLRYTGATGTFGRDITVNGAGNGTISNTGGGTLTLSGTLTKDGRTLTLTGGAFSVTGNIVGASAGSDLVVDGASVTLTGANTYNGATSIINSGTLRVGSGGAAGTLGTGAVTDNGTLEFNRSDTYNLTNAVGGSGVLNQKGGGTLNISGAQSWTSTAALNATSGITNVQSDPGSASAYNLALNVTPAAGSAVLHIASHTGDQVHVRDLQINAVGAGGAEQVIIDAALDGSTPTPAGFGGVGGSVALLIGNGTGGFGLPARSTIENLWKSAALEGYWAQVNGLVANSTRGLTLASGVVTNTDANGLVLLPAMDNAGHTALYAGEDVNGDVNGDGTVDVNDVTLVLSHVNKAPGTVGGEAGYTLYTTAEGDANGDMAVDVNDLGVVLHNLGQSYSAAQSTGGVSAVPEPASLVLLAVGAAGLLRRRRR